MLASKFAYLVFASFVAAVSASPLFRNFVLHEQRSQIPDGFAKVGAAPADQVLNLRLALVNSDMAGLVEKLYAVSTPGSALYGQHLSKEEVSRTVIPFAFGACY